MIEHRHVSFVLAVIKVAKRDVTAVRSLNVPLMKSQNILQLESEHRCTSPQSQSVPLLLTNQGQLID